MWTKAVLPLVFIVACLSSFASAQVIYEPVVVQHGGQNAYYYAGTNPSIHESARFPSAPGAAWGRTGGYAFVSAHRAVVERTPRIFTDAFGSFDARVFGMTIDDVVNGANANLPRYFRKGDLLQSAKPRDGVLIVSPFAPEAEMDKGTIIIKPSSPPLFRRGPVLVIPRSMMNRRIDDAMGKKQV